MLRRIRRTTRISIVLIFLVVLAGSIVRMTGSGMGCPDWPKCFGLLIPPTEESQISWNESTEYASGRMIIHDEELLYTENAFTSGKEFDPSNWEVYSKHDYATFNAFHTWTEYINRLVGALSGLPILFLVILTFFYFKKDKTLFTLSLAVLILLGFEAWLGKTVVDSNLAVYKISMHMFGALAIVFLLLIILRRTGAGGQAIQIGKGTRALLIAGIILSLIQIFLGTQVREAVDTLHMDTAFPRSQWIEELPVVFKVHRSFAIAVVLWSFALLYQEYKNKSGLQTSYYLFGVVLLEVITGIVLAYAGVPAAFQPMHLMFAFIMMALSVYALLRTTNSRAKPSNFVNSRL